MLDQEETASVMPPASSGPCDPWLLTSHHVDPATFAQDESLYALANGSLGVRGGLEEDDSPSQACFLAGVWERAPIEYHERFPGFAAHTDTRIPVADGTRIHLRLGDTPVRLSEGEWQHFERSLDLRTGRYRRHLRWRSPDGASLEIRAERIVSLNDPALLVIRYQVRSIDYTGPITLESSISTARNATEQGDDPRIGTRLDGGLSTSNAAAGDVLAYVVQRTTHSHIRVACAQQHAIVENSLDFRLANLAPHGVMQVFEGTLTPGQAVTLEKYVAYAWTASNGTDSDAALLARAEASTTQARERGYHKLLNEQTSALKRLWENADLAIEGDPRTEQALRFNLFHLFQSSSRDGQGSTAAKGLTGEGYEGHYFWDAEAFMLPAMVTLAPELAREMLMYRYGTLERARNHARELNHSRGALYAWRTISGDECSAYFPSGSAQYHINAAVAWAIRQYVDVSGDTAFLREHGAEMLFETARCWMDVGHFNPRRGGAFCIHDVTGPDEYTALVDNNHYTNRMAQRHLRDAANVAHWLADAAPECHAQLTRRIGLEPFEIMQWQRAAEAMYLGEDARLGIFPQDDTFLDKPRLPPRPKGESKRPLLLELHPLTIYRHQVCKQADTLLSLMLAGDDVSIEAKRRNFDYYEGVTVHDSTLSASTFSVIAAEVGEPDKAWRYFQDTLRVDLDDLHGNAAHGVHMAAMAGSWLALSWGYGGQRIVAGQLTLSPRLPAAWHRYRFGVAWRDAHLRVEVDGLGVRYTLTRGESISFLHASDAIELRHGESLSLPHGYTHAKRSPLRAVIFDLDGVIADTAVVHRAAWEHLAGEIAVPFDDIIAERMKGVDRRGSLEILLERAARTYTEAEKQQLEDRKNRYYVQQIERFGPAQLLPGARAAVEAVRMAGLRIGLASASRNAPLLLERLGIADLFDYVVDAARIEHSKPHPEIFLAAAAGLDVAPAACLGVEDAAAGITSIHAAGMVAVGIGEREALGEADIVLPGLTSFRIGDFVDNQENAPAERAEASHTNA
ncbi:beta-phosphoglucomutase [Dyella sp. 20L07]|uniref:beta-phosphoglucomutase n=1 Tax=Dyella sp. 20L07 TaxID=3384240 RepID=UPI003D2A1288